ncbi:MAG TPA: hypothetical protein VHF06_16895 [Pseudonocardiaceae bacterium]|nr:hypothetical protein [Pseudonocardiaceae bacterium]
MADRLPERDLKSFRTFNFVSEWGELADGIAATLSARKIPVSAHERDVLRALLYSFDLPLPDFEFVDRRDEVLAELNVTDDH